MDLHIFDCSNYIWAGSFSHKEVARGVRESNGCYEANKAPIGGVLFLVKEVSSFVSDTNDLICVFDRPPKIKRKMYYDLMGDEYGYKGNREETPTEILLQKEFAEVVMRKLGFNCQAVDDYEADDVIYTLVRMYKNDYENIYIHTRDSDLTFLVDDNVSIAMVGTKGKVINLRNYEQSAITGRITPYNTAVLRKLYTGDKSDNIPGISTKWAEEFDREIPETEWRNLGDLDILRGYIREIVKKYGYYANAHYILPIFDLITPLLIPYDLIDDSEYEPNKAAIEDYFLSGMIPQNDAWGFEDLLSDYIEKFFE